MATFNVADLDYTFSGQISEEIIYKPVVTAPVFAEYFQVQTGIKGKRQIQTMIAPRDIVIKAPACGVDGSSSQTIGMPNVTLELQDMFFKHRECWLTFKGTWLEEKLDLPKQELSDFITQIVVNTLQKSVSRDMVKILLFGDTASANAAFNQLDGIMRKIVDGVTATTIVREDNITALNQTAGTRTVDYLRNLYEGASDELANVAEEDKVFFTDRRHYNNFMTYLEDKNNAGDGVKEVVDGKTKLYFRGIEVKPFLEANSLLAQAGNPFTATMNNFIIYTTRDNHAIGLESGSSMEGIEQWYNKDTRYVYWQGIFGFAYNQIFNDLTIVSYGIIV